MCASNKKITFVHPKRQQYFEDHFRMIGTYECRDYFDTFCDGRLKPIPEYISAVDIEVRDPASLQDLDKLKYILFGDDTNEVGLGESVTVLGTIYMETLKKNGPTYPISYTQSMKYENREQEELTNSDVNAIKRFRKRLSDEDLIDKFVKMTACNVIGHDNIKEGILYMVANAKQDKRERRERIHGAIISKPGRAKTALLMYAIKLMTRSTFETAQTSTGLSLLAIVENSGDSRILRLGPVAYSLFACIDEFNKLTNVDQEKFFGVMQEGYFSSNKYRMNQKITAATTILASLNPPEGSRSIPDSDNKIDLTDVNIISPIWDRFDLKFYIPPMTDEKEVRDLANAKADMEGRETPDYSRFIKIWMMYAKQNYNPKLTKEAKSILVEAFVEMARHNKDISPRRQDALFNVTRARARLLLKTVADSEDATTVVQFYSKMIENYEQGIIEAKDVIDVGAQECYKILGETTTNEPIPYTVKEILRLACASNPQVEKYLMSGVTKSDYFDQRNNKQARNIYEKLMTKYQDIQIVSKNPITLMLPTSSKNSQVQVQCDRRDQCDRDLETHTTKDLQNLSVESANSESNSVCSEREISQIKVGTDSKSRSQESHWSHSTKNRGKGKGFTVTGQTRTSPHNYRCSEPGCDFEDPDPSKITTHYEELHRESQKESSGN